VRKSSNDETRRWGLYPLLLLAGAALLVQAYLLASSTVERLLREDAETTGTVWAADFAKRLTDLPQILAGAPPSAESRRFIANASELGSIFRFKLFDARGRQVLVSDELDAPTPSTESLGTHNPKAADVLASGRPHSEMKKGTTPDRPPAYVEAYVPVLADGRLVAVTEVYVDQTAKLAAYSAHMGYETLGLVALVGLAFALPAVAFLWRSRQKHRADDRIQFLAHHDEMTGLTNRTAFMDALDQMLATAQATREPVALLYIDVDRFKDINDSLGHDIGDELLRNVARCLRSLAVTGDLVARIGGDEFAIARSGLQGPAADRLARSLIDALAAPCRAHGHDITTTASVGIMLVDRDSAARTDAVLMLKRADIAMYRAKALGRNRSCVFTPEMDDELQARRRLEQLIRAAFADKSLELHFQPLYASRHGDPVGFEALLRLPDGHGGYIPPVDFIPVAEEMGLISGIGAWVLEHACAVASRWPETLRIAVNLSPAQFADGSVVDAVRAALERSGLTPGRLELEITEGLLLDQTEVVMRDLRALKALGASIVMDDFGTGYSSLSYLWKFPFDKIKIDRSFISALSDGDPSVGNIVRTIVALGQQLSLKVTAEGVETESQARFLQAASCDHLQGFLLGRPVPEQRVAALLRGRAEEAEQPSAAQPTIA
jgi:diguanylate cyclase (GGDEF)-like protein